MRRFSSTVRRGKMPRPCGTMRTPRRETRCAVIPVTSVAVDADAATRDRGQPDQSTRQRRLADPIAAEQGDNLARIDGERDALDDRVMARSGGGRRRRQAASQRLPPQVDIAHQGVLGDLVRASLRHGLPAVHHGDDIGDAAHEGSGRARRSPSSSRRSTRAADRPSPPSPAATSRPSARRAAAGAAAAIRATPISNHCCWPWERSAARVSRLPRQPQPIQHRVHLGIGGRRHRVREQPVPAEVTDLPQKEVLRGRQLRKERRRLELAGDAQTGAAVRRQTGDPLAEEVDVARGGVLDVGDEVEERALARAVGADDAVGGARPHHPG